MSGNKELELVKLMMKGIVSELSDEGKEAFEKESEKFNEILNDVKTKLEAEDESAIATLAAGMIFITEFGELVEDAK